MNNVGVDYKTLQEIPTATSFSGNYVNTSANAIKSDFEPVA